MSHRFTPRAALLAAVAACLIAPVAAQAQAQRPAATPAAAQEANPLAYISTLTGAALNALQSIDRGEANKLWEFASASARGLQKDQEFIKGVNDQRQALGALKTRDWLNSNRTAVLPGSGLPVGQYFNTTFISTFSAAEPLTLERVTLRLDEDNVWRFMGYQLQLIQQPAVPAAPAAAPAAPAR